MEEGEEDKYRRYASLPIPTYEEATSSRPASSSSFRGPQEVSDDAERQGLMGQGRYDAHGYRGASVESGRSSEDSNLDLPEVGMGPGMSLRDENYDRRQIEELDYLDASDDTSPSRRGLYHRARLRGLSKHWANLSATFSSLRLPSFRSLYSPVAHADSNDAADDTPRERRTWLPHLNADFHIPDQYKMSAPIFARLFGLFMIAAVIYTLFALDLFPITRRNKGWSIVQPNAETVRAYVQSNVDSDSIREHLKHITSFDHVAGTEGDFYLASWMEQQWVEWGGFDKVAVLDNYVYLNYPNHEGRSVKIVEPEGKRWTAQIAENLVDSTKQQTRAWHGHSKSGEATGHLIYAHGGSREDFEWLKDNGVETEGAIALVRYYAPPLDPALKIRAAQHAGCAGVLIYSDPSDDGSMKGDVWPEGPWRPDDSVQRGSVSLVNWIMGDPLTPGWASVEKGKTISKESSPALPRIPSLPLPWRDAQKLIQSLRGQGIPVPRRWVGGTDEQDTWFTGAKDVDDAPIVELRNRNDENDKQPIWNVHGLIQGIVQPSKKIFVGSHRDAWCFGSVDPGSGSAIMMELVDVFAGLVRAGWRPARSIQFVSWDASTYNFIGSTEYVEDDQESLRENAVAYINVDAGIYGTEFRAAASPIYHKALRRVLNRVSDPISNNTLRELWEQNNSQLESLGADGDWLAWQDAAGTSSIDIGFKGAEHAFPAQSCYDTFEWMDKFGDPGFQYHRTLAEIWALLILEIADQPVIPYDLDFYAKEIDRYIDELQQDAEALYSKQNPGVRAITRALRDDAGFDLAPLRTAAANLTANVNTIHRFEYHWSQEYRGNDNIESFEAALERMAHNEKISHFETDLLDLPQEDEDDDEQHGIPGREQYKHVVSGPPLWGGKQQFPAVRDAMDEGDWEQAQKMVEKAARILDRAGFKLVE